MWLVTALEVFFEDFCLRYGTSADLVAQASACVVQTSTEQKSPKLRGSLAHYSNSDRLKPVRQVTTMHPDRNSD